MILYLSKCTDIMIKDLLAKIRAQKPAREPLQPSKLSFYLDMPEYQEKIKEINGEVPRQIAKFGNKCLYLIGSNASRGDRNAMEYAKREVIDKLSENQSEINFSLFSSAKEIAYRSLLIKIGEEKARELSYFVAHDTVGSGPLSMILDDKAGIEEIEVNSPTTPITVYLEGYGRCTTNLRFADENSFRFCINKLIAETEKELDEESPIIDAQMENARIHAQIRPYALSGAAASIRIGKGKSIGIYGLLKSQTLDLETLAYIWLAIDSKMNIVISGAPASGKTTLLSAISNFIPHYSKLLIIEEEINELRFSEPMFNIVSLYGSKYGATNTRAQVLNALRMRPDRIVIGEIRGEEAGELFTGANLGIPFITTMHSGEDNLSIIKKLLVKPMAVESRSLSMLDVSIHMRQEGIRSRIVSAIYEYRWLSRAEIESGIEVGDGDSVQSSTIVAEGRGSEESILSSKALLAYSKQNDLSPKAARKELAKRIDFLRKAFAESKSDEQVSEALSKYRIGIMA